MISDRRYYLTPGGKVVEDGHQDLVGVRAVLLVGKGCHLADDVARRHGLVAGSAPAAPAVPSEATNPPGNPPSRIFPPAPVIEPPATEPEATTEATAEAVTNSETEPTATDPAGEPTSETPVPKGKKAKGDEAKGDEAAAA